MIKHSQKQLDRINENISDVKNYLSKLGELQSQNKDVFWKALQTIIQKCKIGHEKRIANVLASKTIDHPMTNYGELKFMGGCIQAYDEILNLVEKNQDACDEASLRIKELQKASEDIKSNIDLQ